MLVAAIRILARLGPALGRPLVDHVRTSRYPNMKELRPPSSGRAAVRVLFAFDPQRRAILLVGGDKSSNWEGWYERNVPIADARYDGHLTGLGLHPSTGRSTIPRRGRKGRKL